MMGFIAPALAVIAVPGLVVEYIAPTPASGYIAPAPAVSESPAPAVEYIVPVPVVSYVARARAKYATPASVAGCARGAQRQRQQRSTSRSASCDLSANRHVRIASANGAVHRT